MVAGMKQSELEAFCKRVGAACDQICDGEPCFSKKVWAVPAPEAEVEPKEVKLSPAVVLWPHWGEDLLPTLIVNLHKINLKHFEVLFAKALLLDNVPASNMQVYWWRRS
jgi:hypothetical protein